MIAGPVLAIGVQAPAVAAPSTNTQWLCNPDTASDPCDLPRDTTDLLTGEVADPAPVEESDKPVDCFYVYPTVSNQVALNADPVASPEVQSIARFQAAHFSSVCRVFAPVYRQVPLLGMPVALAGLDAPIDVGYGDVLAAWNDYLAHDNDGRGVIFVGHSQGTLMLRKLIREHVDPNPQLRKQLVGAFLMGGNVTTAAGSTVGGDFANIPVCTRRGEAGCVTAYSTELIGLPSLFGNSSHDLLTQRLGLPNGPGFQVACTDPAVLSGDARPVGATVPSAPYSFGIIAVLMDYTKLPEGLPTSASTWTTSKGRGVGQCVETNGFHRYRLEMTVPEAINELPLFDTHLLDINFGLDRLVGIANQQTETWQTTAH
ncbi:DUF3089 domain-containing protein [Rhodococcus sp. MTM3W5.2]|uniref:DUF3089 domain-containing protein n=1 Tax=Rhodococcus sp. MTM3W5.2 TaxID=1805827 RepID=UPI001CB8DF8D|nr:DUF3089 domain-containing protein [Rhodococcus sp. MTM3W5.2]